jgi:TQO small subunit DoxD
LGIALNRFALYTWAANEKTNGFGIADFTRSRTFARSDFRRAKDRLVFVGPSRWKIFFINRIGAADRKNGFPNPCHASYVDHVQRINRRVPHWLRIFARLLAASLALGMAGALYTSVRLGEDWLRAALYLIISVTLIFTGAGKFSLDHLLKRKKSPAGC